jgi:hypothetical protein
LVVVAAEGGSYREDVRWGPFLAVTTSKY